MKWDEFVRQLFQEAKSYLSVRGDEKHTEVGHQLALKLMKAEGGDPGIVEPAIILHDLGWSTIAPEQIRGAFGPRAQGGQARKLNRLHEINGAKLAQKILVSLGYDEKLTEEIVRIIQGHDSVPTAKSLEERIVKDSDKLWRFTKVGFLYEIKRQKLDPAILYKHRVDNIDKWFLTTTARELARKELKRREQDIMKK